MCAFVRSCVHLFVMKYIGQLLFIVISLKSKEFRTWILLLLLFGYHHLIWAKHLSVSSVLCRIFNLFILSTNVLFNGKTDLSQKPTEFCLSMKYDPEFADATIIYLLLDLCLTLWFVARISDQPKNFGSIWYFHFRKIYEIKYQRFFLFWLLSRLFV